MQVLNFLCGGSFFSCGAFLIPGLLFFAINYEAGNFHTITDPASPNEDQILAWIVLILSLLACLILRVIALIFWFFAVMVFVPD